MTTINRKCNPKLGEQIKWGKKKRGNKRLRHNIQTQNLYINLLQIDDSTELSFLT